jgi:hypothetical protein
MAKASPKGKAVKGKAGKPGKADMVDKGESKEEVGNAGVAGTAGVEDLQPSKDDDDDKLESSKSESKKAAQSLPQAGEKEKMGKGKTDKGGNGAQGKPIGKSKESKEDVAAVVKMLPPPEDKSGPGKGKIDKDDIHKSIEIENKVEVKEGKVAVEVTEKAGDIVGSPELEGLQTSKGKATEGGESNKPEEVVKEVKEVMAKEKGESETSGAQLMLVRPNIERNTLMEYKTLGSSSAEDYLQTQQVLPTPTLFLSSNTATSTAFLPH